MPPIRQHTGLRIKLEPETTPPPQLPTPPESQENQVEVKKDTQTEKTDDQPDQPDQTDDIPGDSDPEWTQRILNMCIILRREHLGLPELPRDAPAYQAADTLSGSLEPPPDCKRTCYCGKVAAKFLCEKGRLENRGKWFFRCEKRGMAGGCDYWEWIETEPEKCLRSHIVRRKWPWVIGHQNAHQTHCMYD